MGALRNTRHELFVQGLLGGLSQERAYMAAGYSGKGAATHASRLARNGQVATRLACLQQQVADKVITEVALDRVEVIRRLDRNAEAAFEAGAFAASNQALIALARTLGMFDEKSRQSQQVDFAGKPPSEMTEAELMAYAEILRQEQAPRGAEDRAA